MSKIVKEFNHADALGRPLKIGDPVVVASFITTLMIGRITTMGEKQIRVVRYDGRGVSNGSLRYPRGAVLLDGPDITMYLLKLNQN